MDLKTIIVYVALTVSVSFMLSLLRTLTQRKLNISNDAFISKVFHLLAGRFAELDYPYVEDAGTHDLLSDIQAKATANGLGIIRVYWSIAPLLQGILGLFVSLFLLSGVFASKAMYIKTFITSPYASLMLLLTIISVQIINIALNKANEKTLKTLFENQGKDNTFFNYYADYISVGKAGKDVRLYNQKPLLMDVVIRWARASRWKSYFDTTGLTAGLAGFSSALFSGAAYIFIGLRALYGMYGIGSAVQYVGAVVNMTNSLSGFVDTLMQLWINTPYLEQTFKYLDLPSMQYKGSIPVEKRNDNEYEIEFHNVSFKYPGSDSYALRNLNLKLHIGRKMAVVGMNGSGKTTMIKLLCRLYDPSEGLITLNGIDIRKYDYAEYMSIFSVVFQDFKLFSFGLGRNVAANTDYDAPRVADALKKTGFGDRLAALPRGLETPLYKDYDEDGVEVSGGEAQKIALARALYKDAPFIILDEPTAALDPIAEYEIYSKFDEICGGKTAVYISHRLSSCRFCDDIAVFHEGRLVQRGGHEALLSDSSGKYCELWNAQAQYYASEAASTASERQRC
jgi:ATP-binding cassette subfamily B protein